MLIEDWRLRKGRNRALGWRTELSVHTQSDTSSLDQSLKLIVQALNSVLLFFFGLPHIHGNSMNPRGTVADIRSRGQKHHERKDEKERSRFILSFKLWALLLDLL